jgi:hypothetical protein
MSNASPPPPQEAETLSTADVQVFEDDGGLPLDDPLVQERRRQRQAAAGGEGPPASG